MNRNLRGSLLAIGLCCAGCTSEQLYNSAAGLRVQDCEKLEPRDRPDCLQHARASYSDYKKAQTTVQAPEDRKADARP